MSEYENVFRRKELNDMYSSGEVNSLDDMYLLEDTALTIKELNKQIEFYKDYKKKKTADINEAVKVIENKIKFWKKVMVATLSENGEKSVKFPGSCNISSRNQKEKWVVNDEEEFIAVLQAAQKSGEVVDDVLEKVIQYNVRKTEASKLLLAWESSGKLEGFLKKAKKGQEEVVAKDPKKTTVSIKFIEKPKEVDVEEAVNEVVIPKKEVEEEAVSTVADYDSI